jgi:hypothetical protein
MTRRLAASMLALVLAGCAPKHRWIVISSAGPVDVLVRVPEQPQTHDDIARGLEAYNAMVQARIAHAALPELTARIDAYAACRRAKRWWQFWKRCQF